MEAAPGDRPLHVGYVMYWGATEPVGFATAVPTVLALAEHARVSLFSFDKAEDQARLDVVNRQQERLAAKDIRWVPTT